MRNRRKWISGLIVTAFLLGFKLTREAQASAETQPAAAQP
jgi:hypothetical protein